MQWRITTKQPVKSECEKSGGYKYLMCETQLENVVIGYKITYRFRNIGCQFVFTVKPFDG